MKPRIALFGLPPNSLIEVFDTIDGGNGPQRRIYSTNNAQSDRVLEYITEDIEIGCNLRIMIMCSGICEYNYQLQFKGADISHVPRLKKETSLGEEWVSQDWSLECRGKWQPEPLYDKGVRDEKTAIFDKTIVVEPMWLSYYSDSKIDYLEKFHKLWIGLNAYATHSTGESSDKKRILALVEDVKLRDVFHDMLTSEESRASANKRRTLAQATGVDSSSDIVRDEVALKVTWIDFLENAKIAKGAFADISKELDGLVFLSNTAEGVFRDVFSRYHEYMASKEGIVHPFNMADAFCAPRAPESVTRFGRLVFHNPFLVSTDGNLFTLREYFGDEYVGNPYAGQTNNSLKA